MGEDFGTWIPRLRDWQPPDRNPLGAPLDLGQQNINSAYRNPGTSMLFKNGTLPIYAPSELPLPQVGRPNEPHDWFYCLPSIRQAFMPTTHSVLKQGLSGCSFQSPKETLIPSVDPGFEQKRLLVNNPSGVQTKLLFSSGVMTPLQWRNSWNQNQHGVNDIDGSDRGTSRGFQNLFGANLTDELKENDENGSQSEMHEDTEELNALLYSDEDSDYTEDDEVTSTGHSPSTVTVHDQQNWFEGVEEVASSCGITKKRKLCDGGYNDAPCVLDTASSMKRNRSSEMEDDAESSCAHNRSSGSREIDSLSSNKKMKKEKIRETVSILQNIIPGVKGKDAMAVLDEAINYLKSLKLKAKACGLESL